MHTSDPLHVIIDRKAKVLNGTGAAERILDTYDILLTESPVLAMTLPLTIAARINTEFTILKAVPSHTGPSKEIP